MFKNLGQQDGKKPQFKRTVFRLEGAVLENRKIPGLQLIAHSALLQRAEALWLSLE